MEKRVPLERGKYYHIYNRGVNGTNIFIEERNYAYFLQLYDRYINPVADTFAYCLLRNHFHLLIRVKSPAEQTTPREATQQFSNFFNSYAKAINRAYQRTGALFQHRYRRNEVNSERYLVTLVHYIHWNPQKHGFVKDFREYPYSSYQTILADTPTTLQREQVLEWFNGKTGFDALHQTLTDEKRVGKLIDEDED